MLSRLRTAAPIIAVLLSLALIGVRLSGVHAHRTLDAAQHMQVHEQGHHAHGHHHDAHHVHGSYGGHAEGQVDVEFDTLNGQADRLAKFSPLWVALLFAVGLFLIAGSRSVPRPPDRSDPRPLSHGFWRPPLRGPPVLSIA